jgi:hypothetical protein
MPQLFDMLLKRAQVQTLLDDGPGSASLQVKHVLRPPDQRNHADMEVRALGAGHGLMTLLPHRILLVTNQKERNWHHGSVGEAALCHTLFRDSRNETSIRVPRMFNSHV